MPRQRRYGFAKPHLITLFSVVDAIGSGLTAMVRTLRSPARSATHQRILLVNLAHLGDVLMITPALRAVRIAYPDAHITLLAGPWSKDLLLANPNLDEVIVFRPSWWDRDGGAYLKPADFLGFVHLLRKGHFDLSINFKSFFQENLAMWLARIPARIGYGIYGGGFFLTHQADYQWNIHTVEQNMALIQPAISTAAHSKNEYAGSRTDSRAKSQRLSWTGSLRAENNIWKPDATDMQTEVQSYPNRTDMFAFEEDIQIAEEFLEAELALRTHSESERNDGDSRQRPMFTFHIGAGYPSKLWGEERFAALANDLASKWEARIVVVGGNDDLPLIARMQQLTREKLIIAAGRLSIRQTAVLISRSRLFIGNDSGPAHIAAAIGVPVVAVFSGENDASVWRPYSENCIVIQQLPECSPCGKKTCDKDHRCMDKLAVEDVSEAVDRILGRA